MSNCIFSKIHENNAKSNVIILVGRFWVKRRQMSCIRCGTNTQRQSYPFLSSKQRNNDYVSHVPPTMKAFFRKYNHFHYVWGRVYTLCSSVENHQKKINPIRKGCNKHAFYPFSLFCVTWQLVRRGKFRVVKGKGCLGKRELVIYNVSIWKTKFLHKVLCN